MITTFSGKSGAGKSSIIDEIEKRHAYKKFSGGVAFREEAQKYGGIAEYLKLKDYSLDFEVDRKNVYYLMDNIDDVVLVDSRVMGALLEDSAKKFYVSCEDKVIAQRLLGTKRFGDGETKSVEQILRDNASRDEQDRRKYIYLYNRDIKDPKYTDVFLDTGSLSIESGADIVDNILKMNIDTSKGKAKQEKDLNKLNEVLKIINKAENSYKQSTKKAEVFGE